MDRKHCIPDPQSTPASLAVDTKLGKLISVLYVPVELPPTPEVPQHQQHQHQPSTASARTTISETSISPASAVGCSVFADFDDGGVAFEQPREAPPPVSVADKIATVAKGGSFRDRLRVRRSVARMLGSPEPEDQEHYQLQHKTKRRRGWGLQLSVSTAFLKKSYRSHGEYFSEDDEETLPDATAAPPSPLPPRDEDAIRDIAGYLRSTHHTPVSAYPVLSAASESSPGMYSSFYSSEEDDEISTPVDEAPRQYLKYFNFDEIKCGAAVDDVVVPEERGCVRSLGCLREQVAGEAKWRREMESELGYLGSVVV